MRSHDRQSYGVHLSTAVGTREIAGEEVQIVSQRSTDYQISKSDSMPSIVLGTVGSINA